MLKRLFKVMIVSSAVAFLLAGPSFAEPISEKYSVQEYEDIDEMSALLQSLVPDVEVDAEGKTLSLTAGSRESMEQALELLHQLDQPLARLALTVQVAGLSPTEQEMLGLQWQQAAIGTSWGVQFLEYFCANSPKPITVLPGPCPPQKKLAKSGQETHFSWIDSQNSDSRIELELRASVRPEKFVYCTLIARARLSGQELESVIDLRLRDGETTAVKNWFPADLRLPASAALPTLGPLFKPPAEPVIIVTPRVLGGGEGG
ncbi:hypothetical protein JST97_27465 [bacterium]|nr:hypothetical protein [bacterium]